MWFDLVLLLSYGHGSQNKNLTESGSVFENLFHANKSWTLEEIKQMCNIYEQYIEWYIYQIMNITSTLISTIVPKTIISMPLQKFDLSSLDSSASD